jgi:hypothetical protein
MSDLTPGDGLPDRAKLAEEVEQLFRRYVVAKWSPTG